MSNILVSLLVNVQETGLFLMGHVSLFFITLLLEPLVFQQRVFVCVCGGPWVGGEVSVCVCVCVRAMGRCRTECACVCVCAGHGRVEK